MEYGGCTYILTNKNNTVLYIGVTSDLIARITDHKDRKYPKSFSARYNCDKLVYFESYSRIEEAIGREKQLKAGNRNYKVKLINSANPGWEDLFGKLFEV